MLSEYVRYLMHVYYALLGNNSYFDNVMWYNNIIISQLFNNKAYLCIASVYTIVVVFLSH